MNASNSSSYVSPVLTVPYKVKSGFDFFFGALVLAPLLTLVSWFMTGKVGPWLVDKLGLSVYFVVTTIFTVTGWFMSGKARVWATKTWNEPFENEENPSQQKKFFIIMVLIMFTGLGAAIYHIQHQTDVINSHYSLKHK